MGKTHLIDRNHITLTKFFYKIDKNTNDYILNIFTYKSQRANVIIFSLVMLITDIITRDLDLHERMNL